MDTNQNWYRQMLALILLSASKAAVDFLTNPSSRNEAVGQLRNAFGEIDYDALAKAMTRAINEAADTSKDALNDAIDSLRERGVEAVDEAKNRAEKQLVPKRGGGKGKLIFGLLIGAIVGYFLFDQQKRDELLDRLTGASGPIQSTTQNFGQQAANTFNQAQNQVEQAATEVETKAKQAENKAE